MKPSIEIVRAPERPHLLHTLGPDHPTEKIWPRFMSGSKAVIRYIPIQWREPALCHWQFIAIAKTSNPNSENGKPSNEEIVATGSTIPFYWATPDDPSSLPDSGWDGTIQSGVELHFDKDPQKPKANALCALHVAVDPAYRYKITGIDIASAMLSKMKEAAIEAGFVAMVVPLRPTKKIDDEKSVWMGMGKYCSLAKGHDLMVECDQGDELVPLPDGAEPYDPWIGKHLRLGASVVKVCYTSFTVEGTKAEWEEWTGLDFDVPSVNPHFKEGANEEGKEFYEVVIPGALVPVKFYPKKDLGVYIEPNLWMKHL